MNELVEGIVEILKEFNLFIENKFFGTKFPCCEGDYREIATAIAERLVIDEEKVFEIAQKRLNAQGEYDLIICDGLAKDIAEAKPIKVKEEQ